MTDPAALPPASPYRARGQHAAPRRRDRSDRRGARSDLRAGVYIVLTLAVLGAALGVLWQWWSPPGPAGYVVGPHAIQPDETEAWIASDGRFAVIGAATGVVAGILVWMRTAVRGPVAAFSLALGGLAGAALTELVGHRLAGGHGSGRINTVLHQLPLSVHMHGIRLVEAAAAVLVYSLCTAFAAEDDLGRPDPRRRGLVQADEQAQYGRRYGDTAGTFQHSYFPPQ
jgi:hypothetical protein